MKFLFGGGGTRVKIAEDTGNGSSTPTKAHSTHFSVIASLQTNTTLLKHERSVEIIQQRRNYKYKNIILSLHDIFHFTFIRPRIVIRSYTLVKLQQFENKLLRTTAKAEYDLYETL